MGGDYTRFTFRPENDYTSVLRQQGRVALDADHNEFAEILDRRLRAETLDVLGQCTVPRSPADPADGLPSSFRIYVGAGGALSIGRGRAYVDGMLAECRGDSASAAVFDATLGEIYHSNRLPYSAQPHYPQAPTPTPPAANRVDLAYLDVWEREVTAIEDPDIREIALGGPDTTTRRQTIWQAKVLESVGVTTCEAAGELQPWNTLTAPSAGRLTTSTDPGSDPDADPCTIGAAGGYHGLENRLYRVEIHSAGPIAANAAAVDATTARYKWSHDNASFVSAIEKLENFPAAGTTPARTVVTVRTLGRDDTLRFQPNDYVEVLDDYTEYRQAAGQMSQILTIDPANRTITLTPQLDLTSANGIDPVEVESRRARARRWGPDALRPVIAGDLPLEDGVKVTFSLDGNAGFHVGDYWVFAARTATGKIEELVQAHPRGILHHYGRLALIEWAADPTQSTIVDCRTLWPPKGGGCCTVIVNPGESIQQAIDSLPTDGGCVCLKTGVHQVSSPVRVDRSNVCIEGESPGTVVRHPIGGPVFHVGSADQTTIERVCITCVRFELGDAGGSPVVEIDRLADGAIRECVWSAVHEADTMNTTALSITGSSRVLIEGNAFDNVETGIWVATSGGVVIRENELRGPTSPDQNGVPITGGADGVRLDDDVSGPCTIEGNEIDEYIRPIGIGPGAARSIVRDNQIVRMSTLPDGAVPAAAGTSFVGARAFAIDCSAPSCTIEGNVIGIEEQLHGGIRAAAGLISVCRNQIDSSVTAVDPNDPIKSCPLGIFVDGTKKDPADGCLVSGNTLNGLQEGITIGGSPDAAVDRAAVTHNRLTGVASVVASLADPFTTAPERIPIDLAAIQSSTARVASLYAIFHFGASAADTSHNVIRDCPTGIIVGGSQALRVADNTISNAVLGVFVGNSEAVDVSGNELTGQALAGVYSRASLRTRIARNRVRGPGQFGVDAIKGWETIIEDNRITGMNVGIAVGEEYHPRVVGNVVDEAAFLGIVGLECAESVVLLHNEVINCGAAGPSPFLFDANATPAQPTTTAGVLVLETRGTVTVDGCRILRSGQSLQQSKTFGGIVYDLAVLIFADAHVHDNEIVGVPTGGQGPSDEVAVVLYSLGSDTAHIDLIDNTVRSYGLLSSMILGARHLLLANNRFQHTPRLFSTTVGALGFDNLAQANSLSVSANRVMSSPATFPFVIFAPHLSAVANVTTGRPWLATTPAAAIIPAPLAQFNLFGV